MRALAYARAVLAGEDHAEALFDEALRLKVNASPWYCARVDLAHGSWLRRHRRVAESRRPLEAAQAVFDALGAAAWSARAVQELAATGRRARPHEPDAWSKLSAQELQVARLAAQGLTNREIGARLYLSHRTVGSHLYRAFPKLGVRSRAELHLALDGNSERGDDPVDPRHHAPLGRIPAVPAPSRADARLVRQAHGLNERSADMPDNRAMRRPPDRPHPPVQR